MNNKTESKVTEVIPEVKKKSNKVEIIKGIKKSRQEYFGKLIFVN